MKTLKLSMEEREKGILMKVQGRKCFGKGRHACCHLLYMPHTEHWIDYGNTGLYPLTRLHTL
jgi:hypothetical protein